MNENEIFNFLSLLGDESAKVTMSNFRSDFKTFNKNTGTIKLDPVTEADRQSELLIRELIAKEFPDHSIIGEEYEDIEGDPKYKWYIDPIDGTKSFISGIPLWGTLVGLEIDGIPEFGLIDNPATNERYIGSNRASYKIINNLKKKIRSSDQRDITNLRFGYTSDEMFDTENTKRTLNAINEKVALTRTGGDCYFYGLLASGYLDLILENQLKPFDIIPIIPIIKGAGGIITNWKGDDQYKDGNIIASSNQDIHNQIINIIEKVSK
ncbi:MAG: inositol monophosphatase family protein [Hyphomicrobiales bacterium]|nr:inositol monophosphatase family protein [Hyphomicrobiales bacterium]